MSITLSPDNVRKVIEVDSALDIQVQCDIAVTICSDLLTGKGLSTDLLNGVCIFLAAHFVCLLTEKGGLRRSRLGEADESFKSPGDNDTGLASTRYGQQAMLLDTSGTLASISANKGLKAQFMVIMNSAYVKPPLLVRYL